MSAGWDGFRKVFRLPLGQRAIPGEVDDELRFHLEGRIEELMARGFSRSEATREARARFGDLPKIGAEVERIDRRIGRRRSLGETVSAAGRDLRYAARSLRRTPGFTAIAILTLALGIGANTAIFSVVDGVLLRPAPFIGMDRLVMVWETDRKSGTTREPASIPDYDDFQRRSQRLEQLAAFTSSEVNLTPEGAPPIRVAGLLVSHQYLPLVGIAPLLGHVFTAEEDRPGGPRVALISESLWGQLFARDRAVIGRTIRINEIEYAVAGVLPSTADFGTLQILGAAAYGRGFADRGGPGRVDLWLPLQANSARAARGNHPIFLLGRLARGVTAEMAQEEMGGLAAELERTYRADNDARGVYLEELPQVIFGPVRPALLVLLGAVALVLLVAAANVANLLLARATTRLREVTVRAALGASYRRLVSQFFAESVLLTGAGAILGVGLALLGLGILLRLAPADIPRVGTVGVDARVLLVTLLVTAGVGLTFGMVPLLQIRSDNLQSLLQGAGGRGTSAGQRHGRLRSGLVVVELAMAVMLMAGAGLLIRSLWRLEQVNPGFATDRVLKAEFELPRSRYPQSLANFPHWPESARFTEQVRQRLALTAGVEAVTIAGSHPLDAGFTSSIAVVGREAEAADWPEPSIRRIDAGYLATMRVPLSEGRPFAVSDEADAPAVALINETARRVYFGGRSPLGEHIRLWGSERAVVGVVGDERMRGLVAATPPAIYLPVAQAPITGGSILVRARLEAGSLAPLVRSVVREIDPLLPLFGVEPLSATLSASMGQRRFTLLVLSVFALVALLLAVVGVHGVLSYTVAQRNREIGIRMALGATQLQVRSLVVGQGAMLTGLGLGLGLAGAMGVTRLLSSLLFGIGATDLVTFAGVSLLLGSVALLASYLPARRATRVSPVEALREQ